MKFPIFLIHGALGSGKTTLISSLAKKEMFRNAIIIENEFASENIDSQTLKRASEGFQIYDINGGCICCSSGQDLVETLKKISESFSSPVPVIIETTGVASSLQLIKKLFLNDLFHQHFVLMKNILLLDGIETSEQEVKKKSLDIRLADLVFITKNDLITERKSAELVKQVRKIDPQAHLLLSENGNSTLEELQNNTPSKAEQFLVEYIDEVSQQMDTDHSADVMYKIIELTSPLSQEAFLGQLERMKQQGAEIYRVKGAFTDENMNGWIIETTRTHHKMTPMDTAASNKIILIGKHLPQEPFSL